MSSTIKKIKQSILKKINDLNLELFVFDDKAIDISSNIRVTPKVDLVGTETSFIIQKLEDDDSVGDDFIDYPYPLINRYILTPNGDYILITNYNSATGEITLKSQIDEAILNGDELIMIIHDSLFLQTNMRRMDSNNKFCGSRATLVRCYFELKTSEDSIREKIDFFEEEIFKEFSLPQIDVYDDTFTTVLFECFVTEELNGIETISNKEDIQRNDYTFVISFGENY